MCARGARRSRSCARRTGPTTTCCAPSSAGASGRRGRGMLRTVRVRDLALIEELELALEPGLNVITGETGAGKSILLQALDVALGGRPDADLVRTGAEEAAVEVLFANVPAEVRAQAEELVRAALVPGEEEALGAERARLVHAERLAVLATGAEEGLYSGEGAVIEVLGRALVALREAAGLDASLEPVRALLESSLAELEEAGQSLGRYARELTPDASRLEAVEERLAQLARLKRKFAGTVEDLIRRRDELMAEVDSVAGGGEAMVELEAAAEAARRAAAEWAGRLSVERRREARELSRALVAELEALALTGARFEARFAESEGRALGPEGWDEIEFFLSTNPGEEPRSLARVASGGELSRIMLALKTLAAADERGATLIFDEVDAGIGGAVAEVVGRKLRRLGRSRQVLCITHLPLIAAFAEHHVVVTKRVEKERTVSTARPLAPTERVAELARMLGGERLTHEVREHAEQLLRRASGRSRGLTDSKGVD